MSVRGHSEWSGSGDWYVYLDFPFFIFGEGHIRTNVACAVDTKTARQIAVASKGDEIYVEGAMSLVSISVAERTILKEETRRAMLSNCKMRLPS